jgi:hypothetical protein
VATLGLLLRFSGTGGNLSPDGDWDDPETGSFERLPSSWIVDWRRFFDFGEAGIRGMAPPAKTSNVAKRIDTRLSDPLSFLPLGSLLQRDPTPPAQRNLAYRSLAAGAEQKLATGQEMARFLGISPLSEKDLEKGDRGVIGDPRLSRAGVFTTTPLWFYILREAELGGGRLGVVGSRIVAETFHRSIEASEHSIVRERGWRPHLGPDRDTFRMVDLLWYAFEGQPELLNPLG